MELRNISYILLFLVFTVGGAVTKEWNGNISNTTTNSTSRMPRKNNVFYTPPEEPKSQLFPEVSNSVKSISSQLDGNLETKETKPQLPLPLNYGKYPVFPKQETFHASPDRRMSKSESNINWNFWNGDSSDSSEFQPPASDVSDVPLEKFENYHYPRGAWKDTPWNNARMAAFMMMMNNMQEIKPKVAEDSEPIGFLSKITKDPSTFLLVAAIPVSILLSAVLPVLMENMNNYPTVQTIASSGKGRMLMDGLFSPVVDGVSKFGYRALEDPGCTQRIFCQVTKGSIQNNTNPSVLQKILFKASRFVDDSYLDRYGVQDLVSSMSDGNCEKVPCTDFNLTDYVLKLFSKGKQS